MLEEVRDLNDNYIEYEYFKDTGQIYPPPHILHRLRFDRWHLEVDFVRTYNPDVATTTSTGFPVKSYYKISDIQIWANGSLVREYDLSYANGYKNINLLLSSIYRIRARRIKGNNHSSGNDLQLQRRFRARMDA